MCVDKRKEKQDPKTNPFSEMEKEVLRFWDKSRTFKRSVDREAPKGDYVFYDGPPFITGLPHYGSLLPSIVKDVVPRYWTMKGYRVERRWGWDCHGLPAENKVEEQLGLKNKKDIEKLGIDKFIKACRDYVNVGSEQWEWYINRIGRWVDMKNDYKTMDLNFMESVIWSFKKLYKKGLIYEGFRSSLHCPRCATPLSKFEITMDAGSYKEITEKSLVVKFRIKGRENSYLLAWTTTPWTLPGNLALAVGEKIDYVEIEIDGSFYILAKDRLEEIIKDKKYKVIKELIGKDLVGSSYDALYSLGHKEITTSKSVYKVYAADFVNTEEGTGIVHIAPNFGEDDFELGKEKDLPIADIMDENGVYSDGAGRWKGFYFKKAGKEVLKDLKERETLFSTFDVSHKYPFCYRCGTSLIYKTQKAWYLKIDKIRKKLLESNKSISWVPGYFKEGRFKYNLKNAPDWCLSRSRYWGSPIPVWRCDKCDEMKIAGSIKELEELSGQKITDLHKPDIDKVRFSCGKCGGVMKRVPEVLDCWFESGSMPYAQWHYPFERENDFNKIFPADFIVEYTGQLRGWFYYLHVLSNSLFDSVAFKNVIVTGVLAGTDGRKMSKSFGNYPDPKEVLEKYGSDALRVYFMGSSIMVGDDMNLSEKEIQDTMRKNIILLWNVCKFYDMFAKEKRETDKRPGSKNILDRWILCRLDQLLEEVTNGMDKYDLPCAVRPITHFIDDLSTWYLRRSRNRLKNSSPDGSKEAVETIGYVLLQLSKITAPFMPFIAEQVWQKVTGADFGDESKSVHLEEWPSSTEADEATKDRSILLEEMDGVRRIVELSLAARDEAGIKVRQPLSELRIKNYEPGGEYKDLIKDELNVKTVKTSQGSGELKVELDTKITPQLREEGQIRDIIRRIQAMRKTAGFTPKDKISIDYSGTSDAIGIIEKNKEHIISETGSNTLSEGVEGSFDLKEKFKIDGEELWLAIKEI